VTNSIAPAATTVQSVILLDSEIYMSRRMMMLQVKQQLSDQGGLGKATTIPVRPAEDDAHVIGAGQ
jgi:hypothetical protein